MTGIDRLAATLALDEPVDHVKLVSPARARTLAGLGIHTVRDLVNHYPRRYIDLSAVKTVASAAVGESCTIQGTVHEVKLKKPRPRLSLVEIALVDESGVIMVTVFRQPWLKDSIHPGDKLAIAGKVEFDYGFKRMTNPFIEPMEDGTATGMIIPVHPATEKLSAAWMRRLVGNGLTKIQGLHDPLPLELRLKYRLMSRGAALACIHFPESMAETRQAQRRLAYEELLLLELFLMQDAYQRSAGKSATAHVVDGPRVTTLEAALPFTLTDEQIVAKQALLDVMASPKVANHLILGDVGTGKTIVAAFGLAAAADSGGQALMMAPTEVLAQQHYRSIGPLLEHAGVRVRCLTGSTAPEERQEMLSALADGSLDVLIGTHALLEDDVAPQHLTLVVIDEQQRFGVGQRARLLDKGEAPDAVYLTATPIPRSLALTLFGSMTLSYIRHRPHDQVNRTTHVVVKSQRGKAYDAALEALRRGEQVYVVCPLIGKDSEARNAKASKGKGDEEDEHPTVSIETEADLADDDVAAASKEAQLLQETVFVDYRVALLHGGMASSEKQQVMEEFRQGAIDVLVATTVIEVGVDVPNATVMIIEDADRFGLSQLHQLRGRVGRGLKAAQVFLISASKRETALARLSAMETTDDGFELASYDLSLRREGDILGNRQHGASALKIVNIVRDGKIIEAAHADATAIIELDPLLQSPENRLLGREVRLVFGEGEVKGG